jgi:hypothetical protein
MLCDDVAALHGGEVANRLTEAQRFLLKRDAVAAAVNVSMTKPSSLISGVGLCKAPYRTIWLEWALADQMDASGIPGHSGRAGLLIQSDRSLMAGSADVVLWPKTAIGPELLPSAFRFDYRENFEKRAAATIERAAFSTYSPEDQFAMREISMRHPLSGTLGQRPRAAGAALNQALIAMSSLMLLNSRNSVEIAEPDISRLNRARGKSGKRPFFSYRTVDLSFSKTQKNRAEASGLTAAEKRLHLVRGHFKVRSTGVFWWMPHWRGDLTTGFADKQYEVRS